MSLFSSRQIVLMVALILGLLLGLVYTWQIAPVELINTYPPLLRVDHRHDWIRMVALAYVADGDLVRAHARLEGLEQGDVSQALAALIEDYAAAGRPADTMRQLTNLAQSLDVQTPAMLVYLQPPPGSPVPAPSSPEPATPVDDTPTVSPTSADGTGGTLTPSPTASPSPTPTRVLTGTLPAPDSPLPTPTLLPLPSRLRLAQQEQVCEGGQPPRIEVIVKDDEGDQVAGIELWLMWPGGADRAVTGLKPQQGVGYADFYGEPGVSYSLGISELGMPLVADLQIENCPTAEGEGPILGSWRIELAPTVGE